MKFGDSLAKSGWAIASRSLPTLYGLVWIMTARILTKEEFGTLCLYQALFSMAFTMVDSIALQTLLKFGIEGREMLAELNTLVLLLLIAFAVLVFGPMLLFGKDFSNLLNAPLLASMIPLLIVQYVSTFPRLIATKLLQIKFEMKKIFVLELINYGMSGILLIITIVIASSQLTVFVVICINIAGAFTASIIGIILTRKDLLQRPQLSEKVFSRVLFFLKYQAGTGLVTVIYQESDALLLSIIIGPIAVALYRSAKIVFKGYEICRDALLLFLFPAVVKYFARHDVREVIALIEKSTAFLYCALLPVTLYLIAFPSTPLHLLYGTRYDASIPIVRLLAIGFLFYPIQYVLLSALTAMGDVKGLFYAMLISSTTSIVCNIFLLPLIDIEGAAISFIVCAGIQTWIAVRLIKAKVNFEPRRIIRRGLTDITNFVAVRLQR